MNPHRHSRPGRATAGSARQPVVRRLHDGGDPPVKAATAPRRRVGEGTPMTALPTAMKGEVQRIVDAEAVTALFQPIVDLDSGRIHGYEGLSRGPSDSFLHSPLALFEAAEASGLLFELERCAMRRIVSSFRRLELPGQLFVNVTPNTIVHGLLFHEEISQALADFDFPATRLVIELTETHAFADVPTLLLAIAQLRDIGLIVALDDLGEGFSSLKRWTEMRPDFVKIDRHFVDGLSQDPLRQQFIRSILDMARSAGCVVVAEGIETESDLVVLRQLGVHHGQGYVFARPGAAPRTTLLPELARLLAPVAGPRLVGALPAKVACAADLSRATRTIDTGVTCAEAIEMFRASPELYAVPVLDDAGHALGLLRSLHTLSRASERYFLDLFGKRSCMMLVDAAPLAFDARCTLNAMAEAVANMNERHLMDGFIVTESGRYRGTGRISDLLRAVSDRQLSAARYANPLTQLPGNVPLDEHVDFLLEQHTPFVVAYWDIGNFKAFNDVYGYRAGDDMILFTAEIIKQAGRADCDMLGHVGGDDFVTVFTSGGWEARIEAALRGFDRGVRRFYSREHLAAGGYATHNRQGTEVFHALATLAAGAVPVLPGQYESHRQISRSAAETKRMAKTKSGSSLFVERRTGRR